MLAPFLARHGAVSSGHGLASLAGIEILGGGNAFDAGIATAMCLSILQPDYAGFVGVAPFIGYSAAEGKVLCYSGAGVAPRRATIGTIAMGLRGCAPRPHPRSVDSRQCGYLGGDS